MGMPKANGRVEVFINDQKEWWYTINTDSVTIDPHHGFRTRKDAVSHFQKTATTHGIFITSVDDLQREAS